MTMDRDTRQPLHRINARNQFEGTISEITPGPGDQEVHLQLDDGLTLVATLSGQHVKNLALATGTRALAFVLSSDVLLVRDPGLRLAAHNEFPGEVLSVRHGPLHTDVMLSLSTQRTITAMIPYEAAKHLDLKAGCSLRIFIPASSIVLGVRHPPDA